MMIIIVLDSLTEVARQLVPLFIRRIMGGIKRLSLDRDRDGIDVAAHRAASTAQLNLFQAYANDAIWRTEGDSEEGDETGGVSRFLLPNAELYSLGLAAETAANAKRATLSVVVVDSICDRDGGGGSLALASTIADAAESLDGGTLSDSDGALHSVFFPLIIIYNMTEYFINVMLF